MRVRGVDGLIEGDRGNERERERCGGGRERERVRDAATVGRGSTKEAFDFNRRKYFVLLIEL
jgi:hypothetical protein